MTPGKAGRAKRLRTRQRAAEAVSNRAPEADWLALVACDRAADTHERAPSPTGEPPSEVRRRAAHFAAAARDRMAAAANRPSGFIARAGFAAGHRVTDLAISSSRQADYTGRNVGSCIGCIASPRAARENSSAACWAAPKFGGDIHPRQVGRSIGDADRVYFELRCTDRSISACPLTAALVPQISVI